MNIFRGQDGRLRLWPIFLLCFCVLVIALAPFALTAVGFYTAMGSFGPSHSPSETPRAVQLAGFIVIGALPRLIYAVRRYFARNK